MGTLWAHTGAIGCIVLTTFMRCPTQSSLQLDVFESAAHEGVHEQRVQLQTRYVCRILHLIYMCLASVN